MHNLYQEEIIEHFKDPHNFGKLENPTVSAHERNPLCGDDIHIDLSVEHTKVNDVAFLGTGCAISIAAASILTEEVKGKTIQELRQMTEDDMLELLGIEVSEARKKCALLGFYTIQDALKNYAI